MRIERITYAAILSGALAWCALILLAPFAASVPRLATLGAFIYAFFSPLCHQIDARSFHLFGEPLAVCGRCSAIYFGFFSGTVAYLCAGKAFRLWEPGRIFLAAAVAPMLADVLLEATGVYVSSNEIRAVTGAWFGVLLPLVIVPGAVEGMRQIFEHHNPHSIPPEKGLIDA
jgi:uncharacterized membrane protein